MREVPEIDRLAWFDLGDAYVKIKAAQAAFLERLEHMGAAVQDHLDPGDHVSVNAD